MKNLLKKILLLTTLFALIASPVFLNPLFVSAQSIEIPCTGPNFERNGSSTEFVDCDFSNFMDLIDNILTFLLLISIPLAAIAFAWAGTLMLTAGGSEGQIEHAKEIFVKVLIGFMFVLTAWLIVKFVTVAILREGTYTDLLGQGNSSVITPITLSMKFGTIT